MVATLLIPMVGPASAMSTYSMTTVKKIINTDHFYSEGNLIVTFDAPTWSSATGSYVYLSLPSSPAGYAFNLDPPKDAAASTGAPTYASLSGLTATNGTAAAGTSTTFTLNSSNLINDGGNAIVTIAETTPVQFTDNSTSRTTSGSTLTGYQMLQISVSGAPSTTQTSVELSIPLALAAPIGENGAITATASAPSSSVFSGGSITIGTVGASTVGLAVESAPSLSSTGGIVGTIDIKENAAGALYDASGNAVLKLTLPPGFTWNTAGWGTTSPFTYMWGGAAGTDPGLPYADLTSAYTTSATNGANGWQTSNDGRELDFYNSNPNPVKLPSTGTLCAGSSLSGLFFKFTPSISVDESTAATGNITVTVGGDTSATVSTLVVGSYGSFGNTGTVGSGPTILAGKAGITAGEIEIKESIPGSLIAGRTITLTLPSNVAWAQTPTLDTNLSTNTGGVTFNPWISEGTNGNEIQGTVVGTTAGQSSPGDFFLQNAEVTPAVDFSGPLTVTIGGSEGITGTATLATVDAGVTAAAASTPSVQIGTASQTLGNITITETESGALDADATYSALEDNASGTTAQVLATDNTTSNQADLDIVAPVGVTFDTTPVVTVTSGNLQLGTVTTGTGLTVGDSTLAGNQGVIVIPIQSGSTTASTITIAAPMVTFDRTVASGPVTFKVEGTAVDETTIGSSYTSGGGITYSPLFPNDTTAAAVNVANVGGVAGTGGTSVFTIGSTSYTLNGSTVTMDVAPYIKDSRTFLPLRYVANALGVADSNIIWNPTSQMVTIIKGGTVLQLTIGSNTMMLNGATITMDTAPEITSGRTCLPVAWVAKALGASITWDATAQTATVTD
jgi:hypothetical protein